MRQIAADTLNSVVESEIIPRLLLAHQSPPLSSSSAQELPLTGGGAPDIDAFAGLALTADIDDLSRVIDAMLDTGVSVQDMFSRLLAPTARRLGVYWEQDISSFTDVAIALGKMQRLVRHYSRPTPSAASGGRRVLLAAVPGEDHTFGLAMIAESFRLANWSVFEELDSQLRGLEDLVRTEAFDAVGLSVASDAAAAALPDVIRILRAASVNRALIVLVGGFKIMERPELARDSGADATAGDGPSAVAKAAEMLDAHVQRV
ncbi:MAG: cobalamin B12-binding domain-containing protein [Caulobacterales bacterium]|jgi:methanogenic corrinoid protein MtbC1